MTSEHATSPPHGMLWSAARWIALPLLIGGIISVGVAWSLALLHQPQVRVSHPLGGAVDGDEWRTAQIDTGFGLQVVTLQQQFRLSWSPGQATGAPNTDQVGDIASAWASASRDGQREWLELDFATPVIPSAVVIHETNAPGALDRVTAVDHSGEEQELWAGVDPVQPNAQGIPVARISIISAKPISRVRLHLNSPAVDGWNEIDAVGLVDQAGAIQWAIGARASTTYAKSTASTPTFAQLDAALPLWARRWPENRALQNEIQTHVMVARGWPRPALWTTLADPPSQGTIIRVSGIVPQTAAPSPALANAQVIPLWPAWGGLAINSVFYGIAVLALYLPAFRLRRYVSESNRLRRGCCMACGYNLRFDLVNGCPECGWRREA